MIQQNTKSKNIRRGAATVAALALAGGAMAMSVAPASAASTSTWDALAQCESGGNWSIDTGNGYKGGLQFSSSTWSAFGGSGSADNASKAEQIRIAERVKAAQGWGAWPACSAKLGLSGGKGAVAETYAATPKEETVQKSNASSYKSTSTKTYKTKSVPAKSYASSGKRAAAPVAKAPAISVNVKDSGENYTVKAGDTLFKIAQAQGLDSWQDLYSLNQDVVPSADLIFVGQSLDLPTK